MILVELAGANDGLNTVVPVNDPLYRVLRPTIGLRPAKVTMLDDTLGLNLALEPLMEAWNSGELAIMQGLGYPGANRSHFKSIALWNTGGDGRSGARDSGWLAESLVRRFSDSQVDAHGVSFGGDLGPFEGRAGTFLSIDSHDAPRLTDPSTPASAHAGNPALAAILQRTHALAALTGRIDAALGRSELRLPAAYDDSDLGSQLQAATKLIAAGIEVPVLKVRLAGFDTHENQEERHRRQLEVLGHNLRALRRNLREMGMWREVIVMTYSEFGRRAAENSSKGTDHGKAAPHFLLGGSVRGGRYGPSPDLGDLDDGDLRYAIDFRAAYDLVLSRWLGADDSPFARFRDPRLHDIV